MTDILLCAHGELQDFALRAPQQHMFSFASFLKCPL